MKMRTFIGLCTALAFAMGSTAVHALEFVDGPGTDPEDLDAGAYAEGTITYARETLLSGGANTTRGHHNIVRPHHLTAPSEIQGSGDRRVLRQLCPGRYGVQRTAGIVSDRHHIFDSVGWDGDKLGGVQEGRDRGGFARDVARTDCDVRGLGERRHHQQDRAATQQPFRDSGLRGGRRRVPPPLRSSRPCARPSSRPSRHRWQRSRPGSRISVAPPAARFFARLSAPSRSAWFLRI